MSAATALERVQALLEGETGGGHSASVADSQKMRCEREYRKPIPWATHPGWSVYAERFGFIKMPPPAYTREEIRAMIVGPADV